jgi:iron(III) transport system substrate-binding protein
VVIRRRRISHDNSVNSIALTDIVQNATIDWFNDLVARGELLAYDSPEYRHFGPLSVNPEIAPANPPYFIAGTFGGNGIFYNPKYVKGEIQHWKDVLRLEYKGNISCADVSNSSSHTESYLPMRKVLGSSFFKELAKQDPFIIVSSQDQANKAISGEYPIAVMMSDNIAFRANLDGAGLKMVFPTEGWPSIGRQMTILTHAPHPNAAKLFLDFYHSEAGQKILLEKNGFSIGRLGMKSKYEFPRPIYDIRGVIPMDWRKVTAKDRDNAREEFRKLVIEKK